MFLNNTNEEYVTATCGVRKLDIRSHFLLVNHTRRLQQRLILCYKVSSRSGSLHSKI